MAVRRSRQKGLRVLNFAIVLVVFKRHHGSERVNELATVSQFVLGFERPLNRTGSPQDEKQLNNVWLLVNETMTTVGSVKHNYLRKYLWCSLCTLYLHVCKVRVTVATQVFVGVH